MTRRSLPPLAAVLFVTLFASQCWAAVILETALPGPTGFTSGGSLLADDQFFAARFSVDTPTQITSVGGGIGRSGSDPPGTLFAAIVSLDGPDGTPNAGPSATPADGVDPAGVVAHTLFSLSGLALGHSDHFTIPLPTVIEPGWYAVVFGGGLFGADGRGYLPNNNIGIPSQYSEIGWWDLRPGLWSWNTRVITNNGFGHRYVVEGFEIPEPGGFVLLSAAAAVAAAFRRRTSERRHNRIGAATDSAASRRL